MEYKNRFYADVIIRRYTFEAPTLLDARDKAKAVFMEERKELGLPDNLVISGYLITPHNGTCPYYCTEMGAPWNIEK